MPEQAAGVLDIVPKPARSRALINPLKDVLAGFVGTIENLLAGLTRERRWVAVERDDETFDIFERKGRRARSFASSGAMSDRQRATLTRRSSDVIEARLLPDKLIEASFKLPAGAIGYVDKIAEHRLERLTPWRLDQVVYGYSVSTTPEADGQYEAHLLATSKEIVASSLSRLSRAGLTPSILGSAAEPVDNPMRIDLFQGHRNTGNLTRRRAIARTSVALLGVAVATFATSGWLSAAAEKDLADVDRDLGELRTEIAAASDGQTPDSVARLLNAKNEDAAVFVLLNRLAAGIPSDTYLSALDVRPAEVHLSGTSADASGLIDVLENKLGFASATFEAPVARLADGRDQFSILAARNDVAGEAK